MIQKLGSYQILGMVRAGSRPLYKAQAPDGRIVALKTITANGVTPEELERFQREAEICATLDHPNLLKVHDSGEADGIVYQAMDLLEGSDLSKILGEGRQFSWEEKLTIMEQVSTGLEYAHKRGLVHRDIKPANIFLENSGNVRILDFGMVKTSSSNLTKVGSTLGTLNYMAPEQIRGEPCTPASDVFSSGIVFYHLASGKHPFSKSGAGLAQIVSAILFETPAPLRQVMPGAPEGLERVLQKALEKDASRRWKDGGEFKQILSLCRLTLDMQPAASGPEAAGAGAPAAPEQAKTVMMRRPGTPAAPRPAVPTPAPAAPVAAPKPAPAPAPAPVRPIRPAAPAAIYCSACTAANPADAYVCTRCGAPLRAGAPPQPGQSQIPWRTIAIATAGLVLLLIILLLIKS